MDKYTELVLVLYKNLDRHRSKWSHDAHCSVQNSLMEATSFDIDKETGKLSLEMTADCVANFPEIDVNKVNWQAVAGFFVNEAYEYWGRVHNQEMIKKLNLDASLEDAEELHRYRLIFSVVELWDRLCQAMKACWPDGDEPDDVNSHPIHQKFLDRIQEIYKPK